MRGVPGLRERMGMVDFGALWRQEALVRRAPDNAAAWDERARDEVSKFSPSGYSQRFLDLAQLVVGESVFDMGCGAGTLAIPCAEQGHRVLAADFSPVMLERCRALTPPEAVPLLETKLLAWDQDWQAAGVSERSFDVAFASRSLATADMEAAIRKLSGVAKRKVCTTVVAGKSPRVSEALFSDLGLKCRGHQDAAFVFGIATQLGFKPEVRFLESVRTDRFASPEKAREAYTGMLRFADNLEGAELECARAQVLEWVDEHLLEAPVQANNALQVREIELDGPFAISAPRTFSWAFISWEV